MFCHRNQPRDDDPDPAAAGSGVPPALAAIAARRAALIAKVLPRVRSRRQERIRDEIARLTVLILKEGVR